MPLRSKLFQGNAKLEAAAVSNPAHIKPRASGADVAKIQLALIQIVPSPTAARVRVMLDPGQVAGLDSDEGRSLSVTCREDSATLRRSRSRRFPLGGPGRSRIRCSPFSSPPRALIGKTQSETRRASFPGRTPCWSYVATELAASR
jgi:hypothetical protein